MRSAGYLPATERRQQILDAAKRVFASRGYHDTNISHICEDLGIARGTLYQYFKSKHEVFAAIVEGLLTRLRAAIASEPPIHLPEGYRPTPDDVVRYSALSLRRVLGAAFEDEASLRILVREAVGLDVHIDRILSAIDGIVIDRFAADIAVAQKLGVIRSDVDPRVAALFVLGGVQKIALSAIANGTAKLDLDELSRSAAELQMRGLVASDLPASKKKER